MRKVGTVIASVSRSAGGLFESVRNLTFAVVDRGGYENVVFGLADRYAEADRHAWVPLEVNTFDVVGPREFGYAPRLYGAICGRGLDVIHNHGIWMYPSLAVRRCCATQRVPYVVSPHGMLDPWALSNSRWKKVLARAFYERAHLEGAACIRALCAAEAHAIRRFGLRNPICVIPNGIDVPESRPRQTPAWRDALSRDKKVLLYLGRIHPKKGLANLLRAWSLLRKQGSKRLDAWHLVVAGWDQGGHEANLIDLARELEVSDGVSFVGPQFDEAKTATFACADAFILPSVSEGLPMVVLEAWSHGLAVVMTPECNLPEGPRAGAALQVDAEIHSIAKGIDTLFDMSEADRVHMGQRGRELVIREFSWASIGFDMAAVYDWILGDGPAPHCIWR